jgi:RsiW-degrading membrane proteinase PrsW (M82 family)
MEQLLGTAPIAVSVLFWAVYHYHKDRHLPEPVGHLLIAFVLGGLAVYVSSLLYEGLGLIGLRFDAGYLAENSARALLAYSILAIGPVEELAKLLPFLLVVIRFKEFDEPVDGIIYASFIGLGYAAVENWQYLEYLTTVEAIARGFASPVIHMLFASIWGHWIAQAHVAGRSILPATLISVAIAASLHGLYDFIVILNPRHSLPVAALGIIVIWLWRLRVLRTMHRNATQEDR